MDRRLKLTLTILFIILLALISFAGLYVQDTKFAKNLIPDYVLGRDFSGYRAVTIIPSTEKETVYYDKDGNVVEKEDKKGSKEEIPVNSEEVLTQDNFLRTKEIIQSRLYDVGVTDYLIRLDEKDGTLVVQLPENAATDIASQFVYTRGEFTIEDEKGQVLLDNSNLKKVQVGYSTLTTGTSIYLSIEFNEDSVEKFKEITNTYKKSTDEEGKDTSKKVTIKIDGNTFLETSFEEEISNGILPLTLGTSTNNKTVTEYMNQASNIAILLNNGVTPVEYTVEQNRYIESDLILEDAIVPAIVIGAILVIGLIFLIIKYKKLGVLAAISYIGFLALFLLATRFFYLVITLEALAGILVIAILNYMVLIYVLQALTKVSKDVAEYRDTFNKKILSILLVLAPALILGIALCCSTSIWLPAYSFGTIVFWGVFIIAVYNSIITRVLFLNSIKE